MRYSNGKHEKKETDVLVECGEVVCVRGVGRLRVYKPRQRHRVEAVRHPRRQGHAVLVVLLHQEWEVERVSIVRDEDDPGTRRCALDEFVEARRHLPERGFALDVAVQDAVDRGGVAQPDQAARLDKLVERGAHRVLVQHHDARDLDNLPLVAQPGGFQVEAQKHVLRRRRRGVGNIDDTGTTPGTSARSTAAHHPLAERPGPPTAPRSAASAPRGRCGDARRCARGRALSTAAPRVGSGGCAGASAFVVPLLVADAAALALAATLAPLCHHPSNFHENTRKLGPWPTPTRKQQPRDGRSPTKSGLENTKQSVAALSPNLNENGEANIAMTSSDSGIPIFRKRSQTCIEKSREGGRAHDHLKYG